MSMRCRFMIKIVLSEHLCHSFESFDNLASRTGYVEADEAFSVVHAA